MQRFLRTSHPLKFLFRLLSVSYSAYILVRAYFNCFNRCYSRRAAISRRYSGWQQLCLLSSAPGREVWAGSNAIWGVLVLRSVQFSDGHVLRARSTTYTYTFGAFPHVNRNVCRNIPESSTNTTYSHTKYRQKNIYVQIITPKRGRLER